MTSCSQITEAMEVGELPVPADANESAISALTPEQQRRWDEAFFFGPRLHRSKEAPTDPQWASVATPDGGFKAWYRDSCLSRARRAVQGDEVAYARAELRIESLVEQTRAAAAESPEVVAALEEWRACMQGAGYDYSEPGAAASELRAQLQRGELGGEALRNREIQIASTDARCYQEANLAELHERARITAEQRIAEEHAAEVQGFRELQTEALERATRLLGTARDSTP